MPLPPWGSLDSGEDGASMSWVDDWSAQAACRTSDPDELFVQGAAQNRAKAVCTGCPVRTECLADALDNRVEFGVWGGMTERERRALLRRRPTVVSWRKLLETARSEYERGAGIGMGGGLDVGDVDAVADMSEVAASEDYARAG
jgi:WhiB family redox-sensing transcriptional regulator